MGNIENKNRTMINHVIKVNNGEYYFIMPEYLPIKIGTIFYEDNEKCEVIAINGKV